LTNAYEDFTSFALYSTVVLAVDVSFLAVPGVEGQTSGNENASTICTYISIIVIVGSMTLSLLLSTDVRRRRLNRAESAELVTAMSGSLTFALTYSLPFALLMWGLCFFLLGLCLRIFPGASAYTVHINIAAISVVGAAVALPSYAEWRAAGGPAAVREFLRRISACALHGMKIVSLKGRLRYLHRTNRDMERGSVGQVEDWGHEMNSGDGQVCERL